MTTITVNKKSKAGKLLLELAKMLSEKNAKDILISEKNGAGESHYDSEFVAKIKQAEKEADFIEVNPEDLWGSLGLK